MWPQTRSRLTHRFQWNQVQLIRDQLLTRKKNAKKENKKNIYFERASSPTPAKYRGLPSAGLPRPRDRSSRRCRQLCACNPPNHRCGSNSLSLSPCCTVGHRRLRPSRIFINIRQTAGQANLYTRVVPMLFATDMLPTSSPLCRTYVRACVRTPNSHKPWRACFRPTTRRVCRADVTSSL